MAVNMSQLDDQFEINDQSAGDSTELKTNQNEAPNESANLMLSQNPNNPNGPNIDWMMQMYGFNPAANCWNVYPPNDPNSLITADENGNPQPVNVPMLQYLHHFLMAIPSDCLVQMVETEDSGPSICPNPTPMPQIPALFDLVQWPPSTWEILSDDINLAQEFHEMDADNSGYITEQECIKYWQKKGKTEQEIKLIMKAFLRADLNGDRVLNYWEYKTGFQIQKDKCCNDDCKIRFSRYSFIVILPLICIILLSLDPDIKISFLIGACIQIMYMVYYATLGYYFWKGSIVRDNEKETSYLYRVFSRPGKAVIKEGRWAPLSMTMNQIAWPLKCIHSVSEFSAVEGAIPGVMLSNLGQYTWAMVMMHFMIQIVANPDFAWHVSDICQIVGVAGLVMLGVFEADPYNKPVNKLHMIGALCGFGTVIGYMLQQMGYDEDEGSAGTRTALSWIIAILFVVFYTLWNTVLSMCYFEEAEAWGMYMPREEIKPLFEPEEEDKDDKCMQCCCICCKIIAFCCSAAGIPLLCLLCVAPVRMWQAFQHKRMVKKIGPLIAPNYAIHVFDFQPALPNWKQFVTPFVKKRITTFSVANVMFEGMVLLCGSTALSLWLMSYENECSGVCVDQIFILIFLCMTLVFGVFGVYSLFGIVGNKKFSAY